MNRLSVRVRLTVLVALVTAAAVSSLAWWGMGRVEQALIDEALADVSNGGEIAFPGFLALRSDAPGPLDRSTPLDQLMLDPLLVNMAKLVARHAVGSEPGLAGQTYERLGIAPGDPLPIEAATDYVAVVDAEGNVMVSRHHPRPVLSLELLHETAIELDPAVFGVPRSTGSEPAEFGYRTIESDGYQLVVGRPVGPVRVTVRRVRQALWYAAPLIVVAAACVAWWLSGRALRPVREITRRVNAIADGSADGPVPVPPTADDIGDLAITMNRMLDRLGQADRDRRQFVSDASHELRSPLTIIRGESELASSRHPGDPAAQLAATVLAEVDRLESLVGSLLTLARSDEGRRRDAAVVDLDDIVLAEAARQRRLPVDITRVSAGQVVASIDSMRSVVRHLLDNACRHGNEHVEVSVATSGEVVVLDVIDDGPGIPSSQARRIFDRFSRLDDARSRDAGGAGLGLAVVAALATEAGGSVEVLPASHGAHFQVRLPASGPTAPTA